VEAGHCFNPIDFLELDRFQRAILFNPKAFCVSLVSLNILLEITAVRQMRRYFEFYAKPLALPG
jgi:hypothetical protein